MGRKHIIHPKYHQEIIDLYLTGNYSMIELAEMYGATNRQPIITILKQNDIQTIDRRIIQDNNVGELEDMIADGLSVQQIADEFGVSKKAINNAIERFDLDYEPQYRTYYFNEHAFDVIDTEEKAYWLGFLYADCHCAKKSTRIALAKKDKTHLEKLRYFLDGDMPISTIEKNKSVSLELNSVHMVNVLQNLGIVPYRNHFHLMKKSIPYYLERHFIRGYIDGDGCISNDYKVIVLGRKDSITWIRDVICFETRANKNKLRNRGKVVELSWGGRYIFNTITEYLYANSTIFMDRKMNRVYKQAEWCK